MTTPSRHRAYTFTLNNWVEAEDAAIKAMPHKYMVYGQEIGANGTPHLQGYFVFPHPISFHSALAKFPSRTHLEVAHGTSAQNDKYCEKEGRVIYKSGTPPDSGKRNDLHRFIDDVDSGIRKRKDLRRAHPLVMAKYPRYAKEFLQDTKPPPPTFSLVLYPWQSELITILQQPPSDREIIFVVDPEGKAGKSTFCRYLRSTMPGVQLMKPTTSENMSFMFDDEETRILLVDVPRETGSILPYDFLESVKDCYVVSGKYESVAKENEPVHIIVFMNTEPNRGPLTQDRYRVLYTRHPHGCSALTCHSPH